MPADYRLYARAFYNRRGRGYDWSEFIRRGTRREAVAASRAAPGDSVLDVCAGTCELALAFARAGAHVTAVDLAPNMLRAGAGKPGGETLALAETDAAALAFPDRAFDVSAISLALHHMPEAEQRRTLAELARVTRRRVVVVEPHSPRARALWGAWAFVADIIDEAEHLHSWAAQDFPATCRASGLAVEREIVATFGLHRITVCRPHVIIPPQSL